MLKNMLKNREDKIANFLTQTSSLQESLSQLQSNNQLQHQQHEKLIQSAEQSNGQIQVLQGLLFDKEAAVQNLNKKISFLQRREKDQGMVDNILKEREDETIQLQAQNKSLQESISKLQSDNQELHYKYVLLQETTQKDVQSLKSHNHNEIQSLQKKLSEKESTEQNINNKLTYLEKRQMQKDEEVLAIRSNLDEERHSHAKALNELEAR